MRNDARRHCADSLQRELICLIGKQGSGNSSSLFSESDGDSSGPPPLTERFEKNAERPPLECRECDSRLFRQHSCTESPIQTWRLRKQKKYVSSFSSACGALFRLLSVSPQGLHAKNLQLHLSGSGGRMIVAVVRDASLTDLNMGNKSKCKVTEVKDVHVHVPNLILSDPVLEYGIYKEANL